MPSLAVYYMVCSRVQQQVATIGQQTLVPTRRILLLCLLLCPLWDQSAPPPVVPLVGPGPGRRSLITTVDVHTLMYIYAGTQGGLADNYYIFSAYVVSSALVLHLVAASISDITSNFASNCKLSAEWSNAALMEGREGAGLCAHVAQSSQHSIRMYVCMYICSCACMLVCTVPMYACTVCMCCTTHCLTPQCGLLLGC